MERKKRLKIILANPRGFCAGVERAVEIVERALKKYGKPVYVHHEIVHNKYVLEYLQAKGTIFTEDLSSIPKGAVTIFSAHGVSSSVEETASSKELHIIDATCPLVKKVHNEIINYSKNSKKIILIGHAGHPEIEGTKGRIRDDDVVLVQNIEDVQSLCFPSNVELAYVTQTTLSVDDTKEIVEALRVKYPNIIGPGINDICYATQNRQDAVKVLLRYVEMLIVVGAKNSSNSNRLRDIGLNNGINSYLIDDEYCIDRAWFNKINTVGITAGASAPEVLLERIIDYLKQSYDISIENMNGPKEDLQFKIPKELEGVKC